MSKEFYSSVTISTPSSSSPGGMCIIEIATITIQHSTSETLEEVWVTVDGNPSGSPPQFQSSSNSGGTVTQIYSWSQDATLGETYSVRAWARIVRIINESSVAQSVTGL